MGQPAASLPTPEAPERERVAAPVILWNARLEEDKQPSAFCKILERLRETGSVFQLVVLG